jgi:hypothetical protein
MDKEKATDSYKPRLISERTKLETDVKSSSSSFSSSTSTKETKSSSSVTKAQRDDGRSLTQLRSVCMCLFLHLSFSAICFSLTGPSSFLRSFRYESWSCPSSSGFGLHRTSKHESHLRNVCSCFSVLFFLLHPFPLIFPCLCC